MLLCDVNVLVYAAERRNADHAHYKRWLDELISRDEAYGVSDLVLSAFLRIATNPKIHKQPIDPTNFNKQGKSKRLDGTYIQKCRGEQS